MTVPQLPPEIEKRWHQLATAAGDQMRTGEGARALELAEESWTTLPEPREQWREASTTTQGGIVVAQEADDIDAAWRWLNRGKMVHTDEVGMFLMAVAEGELRWHFQTEDAVDFLRDLRRVYGVRAFRTLPSEALAATEDGR